MRLVAQDFSQKLGIDYKETFSPIMDTINFHFLISLAVSKGLDIRLMNVITTYLYGFIDNDIYLKIPKGFKLPKANNTKPRSMCSIKFQRSLYGLKQSRRICYNPDECEQLLYAHASLSRNQKLDLQLLL